MARYMLMVKPTDLLMEYKSNVKEREGLRLTPRFFGLSKWKNDVAIC